MCVSVLIPFYNTKIDYIKECLDSVRNQIFDNFIEIVIINDGSESNLTDQVIDYIKNLNTENREFKIFNLDKNYGLPYALNKGLELCSFNYVARMDSDDIMKLDRIQKQYDFMINNKDCVVLGGQCEIMNEASKKIIYTTKHKQVIDKNYLIQEERNNKSWFNRCF